MDFPFAFRSDMVNFELTAYERDHDLNRFQRALMYIKHYMKTEKPTIQEVVEGYLIATDLYLQMEDADGVLMCLKGAEKPAFLYNNGVFYYEALRSLLPVGKSYWQFLCGLRSKIHAMLSL